jgi:hypothetical protein
VVVVGADTAAADMAEVVVFTEAAGVAFMVAASAEVDFVAAWPEADFAEAALVLRAAGIEGVDMAAVTAGAMAATATAAMVDTAGTVTTITDQVL